MDGNQLFLPTNLDWSPITPSQAADLERPFSEEAIFSAVCFLGSNKSPGPDGFTAEFFKCFWPTIKSDMMLLFNDFFTYGVINVKLNETYTCLIPKKVDSKTVSDYRPISLIPCAYEIVAHVLSNRLKKVLPFTIADNQLAFVANRQILDVSLMANEIIDDWISS